MLLGCIGEDEQKLQRFLDGFELFLARHQRACKYNLWIEVYNICTFLYVGSRRDGYFSAVFDLFAHLVSRDCYKQKEFSDILHG